jgi:hypothetical protein
MYAPPGYVPRSIAFPTSPVSADAVLLMTGHVHPDFAGRRLGPAAAAGRRQGPDPPRACGRSRRSATSSGSRRPACCRPSTCARSGFKTVRPHHRFPRLRLELKSAVSWREDVEVALERLLGSMSPDPLLRPV